MGTAAHSPLSFFIKAIAGFFSLLFFHLFR